MMPTAPPLEVATAATICLRMMAMNHRMRDVSGEVAALRARVDAAEAALRVYAARVDQLTAQLEATSKEPTA